MDISDLDPNKLDKIMNKIINTKDSFLEISTNIGCPIQCKICPQDKILSKYNDICILSFDNFCNVIKYVPSFVDIRFSGFSEPFINPCCLDMIKFSLNSGHFVEVFSTLVGLNMSMAKELVNLKIKINLHLPDINNINFNINNEYIKIIDLIISNMKTKRMSMDMVHNLFKRYGVKSLKRILNRAGNLYSINKINGPISCCKGIPKMGVLLPNLDLVICAMDWSLNYKIANMKYCTYNQIYITESYLNMIISMLYNEEVLCRYCNLAKKGNELRGILDE